MDDEVKKFIPKILDRIVQGECIFFLGSYASINENGYCPPSALKLADVLKAEIKNIEAEKNLAKIALLYELNFGRGELCEILKRQLLNDDYKPTMIQKFIAKLAKQGLQQANGFKQLPLIITTNYDILMEKALHEEGVPCFPYSQDLNAPVRHYEFKIRGDKLVLYKFHGCIKNPKSIVITEDDYLTFLKNQMSERYRYPKQFEPELIQNEILFLGYSLEDWTFRVVYSSIFAQIDPSTKLSSYAVQLNPRPEMAAYWRHESRNIKLLNVDQHEFIKHLASELKITI